MPGKDLLVLAHNFAQGKNNIDDLYAYFVVAKEYLSTDMGVDLGGDRERLLKYVNEQIDAIGRSRKERLPCNACKLQHRIRAFNGREYVNCERCVNVPRDLLDRLGCRHSSFGIALRFDEIMGLGRAAPEMEADTANVGGILEGSKVSL